MTNGCKGCVYHCSDRVTTSYRYCDYYGQTGKTRIRLHKNTMPQILLHILRNIVWILSVLRLICCDKKQAVTP